MEAWDSPSALMTLARRSRSASTCRHRSVHRFGDPHDEQKLSVLRLRVLPAALVYINTLMAQDVLGLADED